MGADTGPRDRKRRCDVLSLPRYPPRIESMRPPARRGPPRTKRSPESVDKPRIPCITNLPRTRLYVSHSTSYCHGYSLCTCNMQQRPLAKGHKYDTTGVEYTIVQLATLTD